MSSQENNYKKGPQLYEGKAKIAFEVPGHSDKLWMEFKNDLTAFNAQKKGSFENKGLINYQITRLIFSHLKEKGIEHHLLDDVSETEAIVEKVEIVPIEVVVRNILAGSTAKKFKIEEGSPLEQPLVEFFYKDDDLGDPFISDEQALMLKAATAEELPVLKKMALEINIHLRDYFADVGIELVDFKLEFGRRLDGSGIILADEITPDTCRLWDKKTGEKMDKDVFRRDLGSVSAGYEKVLERLRNKENS